MARIVGINIPPHQHAEIGLTAIYGIGHLQLAKTVRPVVLRIKKIKDLTDSDLEKIRDQICCIMPPSKVTCVVKPSMNIKRLIDIGCYRGFVIAVARPCASADSDQCTHSQGRAASAQALEETSDPGAQCANNVIMAKAPSIMPKCVRKSSQAEHCRRHCVRSRLLSNNTIINITDRQGNSRLGLSSGGQGFQGQCKSTFAAQAAFEVAGRAAKAEQGASRTWMWKSRVLALAVSPVRLGAFGGLHHVHPDVKFPVPHNGCRPKSRRRIWRNQCFIRLDESAQNRSIQTKPTARMR